VATSSFHPGCPSKQSSEYASSVTATLDSRTKGKLAAPALHPSHNYAAIKTSFISS